VVQVQSELSLADQLVPGFPHKEKMPPRFLAPRSMSKRNRICSHVWFLSLGSGTTSSLQKAEIGILGRGGGGESPEPDTRGGRGGLSVCAGKHRRRGAGGGGKGGGKDDIIAAITEHEGHSLSHENVSHCSGGSVCVPNPGPNTSV